LGNNYSGDTGMKTLIGFLILIVLGFQSNITGQEISDAVLLQTAKLGRMLYYYDNACSVATDALLITKPDTTLMGVFLAHKENETWKIGFGKLDKDESCFLMAYEVTLKMGTKSANVASYSPLKSSKDFYYFAAKARKAAMEKFKPIYPKNNYAVLPGDANTLYVYFYPAQDDAEKYYLGGDLRYTYDINSQSIKEEMPLHKTILQMPLVLPSGVEEKKADTFTKAVITPAFVETDILYVLYRKFKASHFVSAGDYIYNIDENGEVVEKIKMK
jgi:hypothetical protein